MFEQVFFARHLAAMVRQISKDRRYAPSSAFPHWAIKQISNLSDGAASKANRDRGGGINAIWDDPVSGDFYIAQVKFDENLIDIDDWESYQPQSYNAQPARELRTALGRLSSPQETDTERFREAIRAYNEARTNDRKIVLAVIICGRSTPDLDREKQAFNDTLDYTRYPKHQMKIFDLNRLNVIFSDRLEPSPGEITIKVEYLAPTAPQRTPDEIVATVKAKELAKIRKSHGLAIYHKNYRLFLGKSPVNEKIRNTLSSDKENFWKYNNGIVVLCNYLDTHPTNVILKGIQIVNGLQTMETLYDYWIENRQNDTILDEVSVLMKIIKVNAQDSQERPLGERIAEYSNTQNPIQQRDLRANDSIQKELEVEIRDLYSFKYQRKRGQYLGEKKMVVDNIKAGQMYLAFWLGRSSDAKNRKKDIFVKDSGGFYDEIFNKETSAEDILCPYFVYESFLKSVRNRRNDYNSNGDFIMLSMMKDVIHERYGISPNTRFKTSKNKKIKKIIEFATNERSDSLLNPIWRDIEKRVKRYADARIREERRRSGRELSIRNVLVKTRYSDVRRQIAPITAVKKLATRLPITL